MPKWITRIDDQAIQAAFVSRLVERNIPHNVGEFEVIHYRETDAHAVSEIEVEVLDEAFGLDWVSTYAIDDATLASRRRLLEDKGIDFVEWWYYDGKRLVMRLQDNPGWNYD
jgi:hypothetical protein